MRHLTRRCALLLAAFVAVGLSAPAEASDVDSAKEQVADLGRQVEQASAEYDEVAARLAAQEARVAAADARAAGQATRIEAMQDELGQLAVETFKRGGVDPQLSLIATGGLGLAQGNSTLTLIAERRSLSLSDLHDAQEQLERLRADAEAELEEVQALEGELATRRADIEAQLAGAQDVLAVAQAEELARVAAEEARRAAEASRAGRTPAPVVAGNGMLATPTPGRQAAFGWRTHPVYGDRRFHKGMDIIVGCGTPVVATEAGTVTSAGWNGSYGNILVLDHGNDLSSAYAHLTSFVVTSGEVSRGQLIGYVGTTGLSTGCHLHFEVRVGGEAVDPAGYL